MTLSQLESLTVEEVEMALYILNVINPIGAPRIELNPWNLTWFKHDALVKILLESFPRLLPEGHATFVSLMQKLGVKVEINPMPQAETSGSQPNETICPQNQNSGSIN